MQPDESSGYRIEPGQGDAFGRYGQTEPAYGAAPASGMPDPYAPAYGTPPAYGVPAYGVPAYGVPAYGVPSPYGPPQPGWYWPPAAPWNAPVPSTRWPYGPDRPGVATAAAVLGFVTAGLTLIAGIGFLISQATGNGDASSAVLMLGIPCAVGQIVGALHLVRRRGRNVLFLSSLAAVAVLVVATVVAGAALSSDDFGGFIIFAVFAVPLPILTAVFTGVRTVAAWLAAGRAQPYPGAPHHM